MIKFLLIAGIVAYLLFKVGSFFFRAGAASQQLRNFEEQQRKAQGSRQAQATNGKKESKVNGGEYIDYEEVK